MIIVSLLPLLVWEPGGTWCYGTSPQSVSAHPSKPRPSAGVFAYLRSGLWWAAQQGVVLPGHQDGPPVLSPGWSIQELVEDRNKKLAHIYFYPGYMINWRIFLSKHLYHKNRILHNNTFPSSSREVFLTDQFCYIIREAEINVSPLHLGDLHTKNTC